MNLQGFTIMIASITIVTSLAIYCIYKLMTSHRYKMKNPPFDVEIT